MSDTEKEVIILDEVTTEDTVELGENTGTMSISLNEAEANGEDTGLALPKKFADAEDPQAALLKAYLDLEKKLGKGETTDVVDGTTTEEDSTADEEEEEDDDDAIEASDDNTADSIGGFQDLWAKQGGNLTDKQWENVAELTNLDMDTLKKWEQFNKQQIAGSIASHDAAVYAEAGGEDKYEEMITWASNNLSEKQLASLDAHLDSPEFYKLGMGILKEQYEASNGKEPSVKPKATANTNPLEDGAFMTEADIQEAMADPRYGTSSAYEREFDRKLESYMKRTGQLPR